MNSISVVGSGMHGVTQLTHQAKQAIASASRVCWVGSVPGLQDLLRTMNVTGEDLSNLYLDGAADTDNYARIKARVIKHAEIGDVTLVVPGHPRVGVTIVQELQQYCSDGNQKITCLPGISSFDAMINDVALDPLEEGSCLVDANRLILYDYKMEPSLNYFIYHVCSVGTNRTDFVDPARTTRVDFLREKLEKHYPENHKLSLLSASTAPGESSNRVDGTLGKLHELMNHVTFAHTLYVPAQLPSKENVNWEFLKLIQHTV